MTKARTPRLVEIKAAVLAELRRMLAAGTS